MSADTTNIAKLLEYFARAVAAHDRETDHRAWGIGLHPFDLDRLGLEEGEEILHGIVKYHVVRFQMIAPISAANTSERPDVPDNTCALTMPLAIVAATLIEMKAPTRLSTADIATATRGFSAPVAIAVATALAVSWKPLVKSKQTPVTTTSARMTSEALTRAIVPGRPATRVKSL